ncbi:MAG: acetyl-CoA carboxylase biotin carboxyl carrier protein subunit [Chloroflexota bacterium]|nr:acetyl-CoA carboxylase biotin carboxyl carrier protein subunit [Chloroflexota bacterium]
MKYKITVEGETFEIEVGRGGQVWVNRRPYDVDFQGVDGLPQYSLLVNHRSYEAHVEQDDEEEYRMLVAGRSYRACLQQERGWSQRDVMQSHSSSVREPEEKRGEVCAPLPGLLVAAPVVVGQEVACGEVVAVLESMKMNLELCAPWDGVVQALHGIPGTEVRQGEVLAVIGPDE